MDFFTDTHAHLHNLPLSGDITEILNRAYAANVKRFITIGVDLDDSRAASRMAGRYPGIYAAVGVHPHHASEFSRQQIPEFETLLKKPNVAAVGEVGLDYHYNHSPQNIQKEVFALMAEMALSANLPLIIHCREAAEDSVKLLTNIFGGTDHRIIFHCFSGDKALLSWGTQRENCMFSFAGNVTYPKAALLHEALEVLPVSRILAETDCPYLAPVPYRGKQNEPSYMPATVRYIAQAKKIPLDVLTRQLEENFTHMFAKT